uniref:NADH-ubiquinone oxidoreductase chain 6 n=1 Tax=Pseudorhynchus acuminatus TaxID=1945536 RepID=A0A1Q1MPR2_9ORTH|nr:NADH dehydrogenase subunit 6 [Pseudorhynchus acuminatus]AQM40080.1 NADH dehydrogenase subunit 6 [Pseudorhynchus acuminatus]
MLNLNIIMLNVFNSLMFTQINHPLAMTLIIIIQTLLVALSTGLSTSSFWFSYILFLVFLGGMLVLFIYISSLASNELFSIPIKYLLIMGMLISFFFILSLSIDYTYQPNLSSDMMTSSNFLISPSSNNSNNLLMKLYNNPTNYITLMLVSYLLLTLIVIVKITNIFFGPLRQSN